MKACNPRSLLRVSSPRMDTRDGLVFSPELDRRWEGRNTHLCGTLLGAPTGRQTQPCTLAVHEADPAPFAFLNERPAGPKPRRLLQSKPTEKCHLYHANLPSHQETSGSRCHSGSIQNKRRLVFRSS